jgi:hypothetical protein
VKRRCHGQELRLSQAMKSSTMPAQTSWSGLTKADGAA